MTAGIQKTQLTRREDDDAGFSLIEILVTLALISVLSGLLIASVGQFRSMISLTDRNDATIEVDALANYLANSLGNLRLLPILSEQTSHRLTLVGTNTTLKFIGINRIGSQDYALREITFFTQPIASGASELVQSSVSRRIAPIEGPLVIPLAEIDKLAFAYLWKGEWRDEWSEGRPPAAVKITVGITRIGQSVSATRTVILPDRF